MQRKIYQKMIEWKEKSSGKTALLIDGARRVGKSYIAEKFAKEQYKSYILINFDRADNDIKELFEHYRNDLDTFFVYLSAIYQKKLYPRESLLIFDEVQMYPKARSMIKYLVEDGRYDYIETGSLMSIRKNVKDILIPSEERHIKMYPMDFEEFLWAMDNEPIMNAIKLSFKNKTPLPQKLHRMAMDNFRQYLIVGGMPQAVAEYIVTRDFDAVDAIKRDIISLYRADINKHAGGYTQKVESVFDEIPSQLQKHEKKFSLSALGQGTRFRSYENAFLWLNDAMLVNICYNSTQPSIGLKLNRDNSSMKLYMADTGLLISHAFDENAIMGEDLYKKLLLGKLELNEGMLFENIVAQMLTANGHKLYFYSNSSRADASQRMEIDFLIAKSRITNRHNIFPIEVKSSKRYTLTSLRKFSKKFSDQLDTAIVLHIGTLKVEDGIMYLPVYMTGLL